MTDFFATEPAAKPEPKAPPVPEPAYWMVLIDFHIQIGPMLVSKRRGDILVPHSDAHVLEALKRTYIGKPLPLRRLSRQDFEDAILRSRL